MNSSEKGNCIFADAENVAFGRARRRSGNEDRGWRLTPYNPTLLSSSLNLASSFVFILIGLLRKHIISRAYKEGLRLRACVRVGRFEAL